MSSESARIESMRLEIRAQLRAPLPEPIHDTTKRRRLNVRTVLKPTMPLNLSPLGIHTARWLETRVRDTGHDYATITETLRGCGTLGEDETLGDRTRAEVVIMATRDTDATSFNQ
jgi:hypothetical protein